MDIAPGWMGKMQKEVIHIYIETHMHISLDGIDSTIFRRKIKSSEKKAEELIRKNIRAYKDLGIIAVRDGGDPINLSAITRRIAKEEGIIYKTPIHAIHKRGYYGSYIGKAIDDIRDFKIVFSQIEKENPDFIKIPLSGMMDFDTYGVVGELAFNQEELDYIVKFAQDKGLPTMVHVNSREGVQRAIKAGVDTIEHGYYMGDEELYALKESEIIWVPTLAPLGNICFSKDERYKEQRKTIKRIFDEQSRNIKKAYEIGVKLAIGSDGGAYKVPHGQGFLNELKYMNEAGIELEELKRIGYENGKKVLQIT